MEVLKEEKKITINLSLKEAENLFCYLQVVEVKACDEFSKYINVAEKIRFALEYHLE
jgi:hypothetical protein